MNNVNREITSNNKTRFYLIIIIVPQKMSNIPPFEKSEYQQNVQS